MSTSVTIEEAQVHLRDLIARLRPGDQVLILENQKLVAKLIGEQTSERKRRVPGNCKGMISLQTEDEEHLKDFAEYLP